MANLDVLLTKLVGTFLLPPLNLLLLIFLGLCLLPRRPHFARKVFIVTGLFLYLFSTPIIVGAVRHYCETLPPLDPSATPPTADAIVVLAGGLYRKAPEYGAEDTVNGYVLERLRYAARLRRLTGKPILVTGGSWREGVRPEAQAMKESLEQDFHIPVQWVEDQSRNTFENAQFSASILRQHGVHTIYLVTHALHMPRARDAFERAGVQVIPAPTLFAVRDKLTIFHFLPQASSFAISASVFYEALGRLWYALK
jgi:uncharacterized SAM-binding protein YcdF (DUF218 family)